MKARTKHNIIISLLIISLAPLISSSSSPPSPPPPHPPVPTPWPPQFHSILFMNDSDGRLQLNNLYYDYHNGRNIQLMTNQLGKTHYAVEWSNGTTFYYTLGEEGGDCKVRQYPVGILRPNWLDGAHYLGQVVKDGFVCNLWEKVDFVWYYEDVATKRPVYWAFYTGMVEHVMTFEVGVVLDYPKWQAPVYCFDKESGELEEESLPVGNVDVFMGFPIPNSVAV